MSKKYWLVKSEPEVFSINDLINSPEQTTHWDGVRNYQARNTLRDDMKNGDGVLFYHSNTSPLAVVGACEVVKESYPDFTAFNLEEYRFDPKSDLTKPTWFMVDIKLKKIFSNPVTLDAIKQNPKLQEMKLIQRGNRLSVMQVTKEEFDEVFKMGK